MLLRLLPLTALLAACSAPGGGGRAFEGLSALGELDIAANLRPSSAEGATHEAGVSFNFPDSLTATDSGLPGLIVQLDVPAGVALLGVRVLTSEALRDNDCE